jgi:amidohydrolase
MSKPSSRLLSATALAGALSACMAVAPGWAQGIDEASAAIESKVIEWRRDIHQHPELGNQETRTAELVAEHLKALGYEVREGVAVTGVVGVLEGGKPGPVVALRADMDALPVTEAVDVPFASKVRTTWNGEEVGVMHACGHDGHTAILMGVAEVLAGMRDELPGTVVLIFQPAEESLPSGEIAGARLMLAEGAFEDPRPDAIFGLHLMSGAPTGEIGYREGPILASSDTFHATVKGVQTHGAIPWKGVDPIVLGSQIVLGFQTIVSRQIDLANQPAVLTVGTFKAGTRHNIVPEVAEMSGTLRTYDEEMRGFIKERMQETASLIAQAGQGTAELSFEPAGYATTVNDPALTERMAASLEKVPGSTVKVVPKRTPSEDFSFYAQEVPGMFVFIGATPPDSDLAAAAPNHSPEFFIDEASLLVGVRALLNLTLDYLQDPPAKG